MQNSYKRWKEEKTGKVYWGFSPQNEDCNDPIRVFTASIKSEWSERAPISDLILRNYALLIPPL